MTNPSSSLPDSPYGGAAGSPCGSSPSGIRSQGPERPGFWPSWVGADLVAGRSVSLSELQAQGDRLTWLEGRPLEKGRTALVCQEKEDAPFDLLPPAYDIGTRVHEYGGGAYRISPSGRVVFSERRSNAVLLREPDGRIVPLAVREGCRYADFSFSADESGVFAVCEDHSMPGEPRAAIVWLDERTERALVQGDDFYAAPRLSPDGGHLCWIAWSHPDMPWDATRLGAAALVWKDGEPELEKRRLLGNADRAVSYVDPVWEDNETLLVSSDETGIWRPCRFRPAESPIPRFLPDPGGESGFPHWVFGQTSLRPLPGGRILAQIVSEGLSRTRLFEAGAWRDLSLGAPAQVPVFLPEREEYAWIDTPPDRPPAIVRGHPETVLRSAFAFPPGIDAQDCARPEALTFPVSDGGQAHALFYPPCSRTHALAPGEKPPLVVMAHGGPTGRASTAFSFKVQWWTSRGFAVLDVNYRGSTGFGRAYRTALEGQWGVRDVEDCIAGVRHVVASGRVDPARCVIRGSSAGGLTVLMALARSDVFAAGCSLYGVTDLRALAEDTHKFESRYLDRLIGPYPEQETLYLDRSPLTHVDAITAPVLFLHGDEDKVVPLDQARSMHKRLQDLGRRTELHVYPGESHGFRQRETLQDSFARELDFYRRIFMAE
ncbi:alpha/beta hydrolase family protein [Swaminathania salitolerans]|uniref:alpha/beta hydrolase family protein n=1 Tax=Swaminathania salitolerans TaxID=182838 RepID=UPI0011BFDC02|nr:S9 family peptidase [Swaminathania salitolerans]